MRDNLCCMYLTSVLSHSPKCRRKASSLNILKIAHLQSCLKSIWVKGSSAALRWYLYWFQHADPFFKDYDKHLAEGRKLQRFFIVSLWQVFNLWLTTGPCTRSSIRRPWKSMSRSWGPCRPRWRRPSMSAWGPTFLTWSIRLGTRNWREWASMEMSSWVRCVFQCNDLDTLLMSLSSFVILHDLQFEQSCVGVGYSIRDISVWNHNLVQEFFWEVQPIMSF